MYVLDTDHLSILQRQSMPEFDRLLRRLNQCDPRDLFTTIVSFHEQVLGWTAYLGKSTRSPHVVRGYEQLERLLAAYQAAQVLPFGPAASDIFDELRRQGIRIGTMDLRIASIAIAGRMTVLTRNGVDFGQVSGLNFEDWTADDFPPP